VLWLLIQFSIVIDKSWQSRNNTATSIVNPDLTGRKNNHGSVRGVAGRKGEGWR